MEPQQNKSYAAVQYGGAGFLLLKSTPEGKFICESYKNASLPTLQRECGVFFDNGTETTLVAVDSGAPLLIPKAAYQPPAAPYLRMQVELTDNDEIFEDELGEYVALYTLPLNKTLALRTNIPSPRFQHILTLLYRYLDHYNSALPNKFLLHFNNNRMSFILIKNGKLFLINEMEYATPEDALYFTLNILQHQAAQRAETDVLLCGMPADGKKLFKLFSQYLPHVQMAGSDLTASVVNLKGQSVNLATCLQLIEI